jgi:hypothetical protein
MRKRLATAAPANRSPAPLRGPRRRARWAAPNARKSLPLVEQDDFAIGLRMGERDAGGAAARADVDERAVEARDERCAAQ